MTTIANLPLRQESAASYRTNVKTSLVSALRSVFTNTYKDPQFQNLRIYPDFSLTRTTWPAMYVRFLESDVRAAGVGHVEFFPDMNGLNRKWLHSIFQGTIEFDIFAESTLDRDIIADGLVEVLRFGTVDDALNQFFVGIYGDAVTPYSTLSVMHQIALNTDHIVPGGDSVGPVPWGAEDLLLFQTSYSMDVFGGYYNTITTSETIEILDIVQIPYLEGTTPPAEDNYWKPTREIIDRATAKGYAHFPSHESYQVDKGIVIGKAKISASINSQPEDVGTVTAQATFSQVEVNPGTDAAIATGQAAISSVNTFHGKDQRTETAKAVETAADTAATIDSGQVAARAVPTSVDTARFIDAATVEVANNNNGLDPSLTLTPSLGLLPEDPSGNFSAIDIAQYSDSGTE